MLTLIYCTLFRDAATNAAKRISGSIWFLGYICKLNHCNAQPHERFFSCVVCSTFLVDYHI